MNVCLKSSHPCFYGQLTCIGKSGTSWALPKWPTSCLPHAGLSTKPIPDALFICSENKATATIMPRH